MKIFTNIIILFVLSATFIMAQTKNVGIGTTTPNASAILDLTATDMGLLIPRMTTAERDLMTTLTASSTGLIIYNKTDNKFQYYNGTTWINLLTSNSLNEAYVGGKSITVNNGAVQLNGSNAADETLEIFNTANGGTILIENTGTGASLLVNDQAADTSPFIINDAGNVGIGTSAPGQKLTLEGTLGILETGTSPTYHSIFVGGDQAGDITYTLPTAAPTVNGQVLSSTIAGVMSWVNGGGGGSTAISSLTNAASTNSIDNQNHSQTWNWSTANNQNALSLSANVITSGTILDITTTTNTNLNSDLGLLRVANLGTSTNGIIFRAQSNSTAGSGLTVLASGNIGVNNAAPGSTLDVKGTIRYSGATSGYVALQAPIAPTSYTLTLPAAVGSNGQVLTTDASGVLSWATVGSGSASLSSLTAATAVNSINNANWAQTWNWPTATTEIPMTITANTLTSGTILDITTTSGSENSTNGLLRVFNNSASTNGIVFRAQSNITAGTGLTVLASGNIGVNNAAPGSTLDVKGTVRYTGATSGYVALQAPTAPTSYTLTLPTAVGTNGQVLTTDASGVLSWANAGSGSVAISGLTVAIATNTIDNTNYAQTWNWNSATTEIPLTLSANAITTGTILDITSSYASGNSTTGLLRVVNTGSGTSGIIFRAQSNSTAGSGLTVYADGNIGVATSTAPTSKLGVNGSIALPIKTVTADYTATADDYTILVNVDVATISLPQASTCTGRVYVIKKIFKSSGIITIAPNASELIDGAANILLTSQWSAITIQTDGTSWYLIGKR